MKRLTIKVVILFSILISTSVFPQGQTDALKYEAQAEMKTGRYGDAIDLLNKYVSAHPQEAEGYNLRGLCYEKRNQFELAVYDFRSARKLLPNNNEINQNLTRATDTWYKLLYNKIEGHKREIAINSKRPINYLEIGKSYKNLGEWLTAEEWYDKYLALEPASPDEIIRYTEILAKNNHIQKGEPILKKYTEQNPTDQRLWSRYGYFELWLGKNKNAIDAFEKALAIKPYFKEAMDGLDQAKGYSYIYTVNDTSYRYGKGLRGGRPEFPIDRYYRILKNKPGDNDTRFTLIDELVKYNRIEEAYNQLLLLQRTEGMASQERYKTKFGEVNQIRDSIYKAYVNVYLEKFNKNNADKESAVKLAEGYTHLYDYDNATDVLTKYLANVKESDDLDVRFTLAKLSAGSYKWNEAFNQSAILLKYDPKNKDYRLFNDRLVGWNVINAKPEEIDNAIDDLAKLLKDDPNNLSAIVAMVYLNAGKSNFPTAESYYSSALKIDPKSKEVEASGNFLNSWKQTEGERELYRKRGEVAKLMDAGDYQAADAKYDEIISKLDNPDKNILMEYAYVKTNAKKYDKAISIYNGILSNSYDLDVDIERAKLYRYMGDSTKALEEFSRLADKKPNDFYVNLYLTDSYLQMHEFGKARDVLQGMDSHIKDSTMVLDSVETSALNLRYQWLPATGWAGLVGGFGRIALSPNYNYYSDNHGFELSAGGGSILLGINTFLSVGASFGRTTITSSQNGNRFTTFKGNLYLRFSDYISGSTGFGTVRSNSLERKRINDIMLKYEDPETLLLYGSYETNDARIILFSPFLTFNSNADIFKFIGYWQSKSGIRVSGYFTYLTVTDGNAANQFQAKIGKEFYKSVMIGYEYEYQNFSYVSWAYYSPQDYQSHSIWAEWKALENKPIKVVLGGRLGYIPASDFIIREAYADAIYSPLAAFLIQGRISLGSTYRFDTNYNSVGVSISAYWSF